MPLMVSISTTFDDYFLCISGRAGMDTLLRRSDISLGMINCGAEIEKSYCSK